MRDELLNETLFLDLDDARAKIANWVANYNVRHPHASLKYLILAAYAAHLAATDDRPRKPDQLRQSSVAPLAPLQAGPHLGAERQAACSTAGPSGRSLSRHQVLLTQDC